MSDRSKYVLGGLPSNVVPIKPSASAAASTPAAETEPQPTRWKEVPGGRVIVNPNECMICHRRPHHTTPHHHFIPAEATELIAARLGWPTPPNQEPLL